MDTGGVIIAIEVCPNLWLSGHTTAARESFYVEHGILARLSVLNDDNSLWSGEPLRASLRLWPPDGLGFEPWHVMASVQFLERYHKTYGWPTLVHCHSGASRSVSVIVAYLHKWPELNTGQFVEQAGSRTALAKKIREVRGVGLTLPHEAVWASALEATGH